VYLARPYPALLAGHRQVAALLQAEAGRLAGRLGAADVLTRDADLVPLVTQFGAGDEFKSRLDQATTGLAAAESAQDQSRIDAAVTAVQQLDADLQAAVGGRLPTAGISCENGAPTQLIVVHLATQQLVAYQNGCPMLRTPITTGRSALPTFRGTFHIYYKAAQYHMISPWPLGSPFYYPPTWVADAMEFIGNGTFIHSADWEPADAYGPGSEDGPYASHGCVHVMDGPLQQLYDWAAIGATVVVED
jgi:lipoprotein-anchoring transpeptidase ErfK/SrfK